MGIANRGTATTGGFSAASPITVTMPSGVVSGDVAHIYLEFISSSGQSVTTPSGWTSIAADDTYPNLSRRCLRRVCDGTEGASVSISFTGGPGTSSGRWVAAAWSGVDSTTPEDVAATTNTVQSVTTTPTQTSQTTVTDGCRIVGFFGWTGTPSVTGTPGGSAVELSDANDGNNYWSYLEDLVQASHGAVALSATTVGNVFTMTVQNALRPAASGTHTGSLAGRFEFQGEIVTEEIVRSGSSDQTAVIAAAHTF